MLPDDQSVRLPAEEGAMSGKADFSASAGVTDRPRSDATRWLLLAFPAVRQVPAAEIQIFLAIVVPGDHFFLRISG